jgi:hypothetical protein
MEKAEVEKLLERINKYINRGIIHSSDLNTLEVMIICDKLQKSGYKFEVKKGKLQIV